MIPDLVRAAWGYRGFIYGSVQREFQSRYRNSLLGAMWNIINPLAMIIVYTVIFHSSCTHVYRVLKTI